MHLEYKALVSLNFIEVRVKLKELLFSLAIPEDGVAEESDDEDKVSPDERISIRASDKRIAPQNEYSDSEDEGDNRRDERSFKKKKAKTEDDDKKDVKEEKISAVVPPAAPLTAAPQDTKMETS